ncbi:MAG: OadG family protein [Pseudomonadales bacterium]
MTSDLLTQGLELMVVGMGTVFAFLTLLVFATATMSRLIQRWQGADDDMPAPGADRAAEVAAIAAAIALHRRRR